MEVIEAQLKELIINRYGSLKKFTDKIGMPWTTLDSILKRGIPNATIGNVLKITKELNIDTESLANGSIVFLDDEPQTIAAHFDGDEFTDEEMEDIHSFIEFVKSRKKS